MRIRMVACVLALTAIFVARPATTQTRTVDVSIACSGALDTITIRNSSPIDVVVRSLQFTDPVSLGVTFKRNDLLRPQEQIVYKAGPAAPRSDPTTFVPDDFFRDNDDGLSVGIAPSSGSERTLFDVFCAAPSQTFTLPGSFARDKPSPFLPGEVPLGMPQTGSGGNAR